ncbi:hypothetical protein ANO11243_013160 [Dothideomycetidae sp. 11243]|nr:hypothetical protein ANO11243_013160 [fungal sp. No.11243]
MGAPTEFTRPYATEHEQPNGENDSRPTAMKVVQDQGLVGRWGDKVVLITGCNVGIGLETARAMHATGAKLFITARTQSKGALAIKDIMANSPSQAQIEVIELELDSLDSVRAAAQTFLTKSKQLNVMITNAGIMAPPHALTKEGFESQLGTNHFAHFLLFQLLKPALLSSWTSDFSSRVVTVSSSGHKISTFDLENTDYSRTKDYDKWRCYGESKTANIWMANEIERRYGGVGVHAISVHPGPIFTSSLGRSLTDTDMAVMESFRIPDNVRKTPAQGAATQVWCATAGELEGKGGFYAADCGVAELGPEKGNYIGLSGYAPHAYDEAGSRRLWDISCDAVGISRD